MHDFNFFRSYQKSTRRAVDLKQGAIIGLATIVIIIGGILGFNFYRMHVLEADMRDMNQFMSAPENIKKYQHYIKTKEQLSLLTSYFSVADRLNRLVDNDARVSYDMINVLTNAMPVNITLQSSKINAKTMEFQGVTDNRLAVAEYEHNLIKTGFFKDVFVGNIDQAIDLSLGTPKAGFYTFSIKCELKDVKGQ